MSSQEMTERETPVTAGESTSVAEPESTEPTHFPEGNFESAYAIE